MAITVRAVPSAVTWNLFRLVDSIPGDTEQAQINPETAQLTNLRPERTRNRRFRMPNMTLTVGINRDNTMVLRTADQTDELLRHEQGHYSLLILVTRALARDLEALETDSVQDLADAIQEAQTRHDRRAQAVDGAYDTQTDHGRNVQAQARWNTAIDEAMRVPAAAQVGGLPL